ncbi:GNAT family N-acetyltransferase [Amycolatopsis sulphurea]
MVPARWIWAVREAHGAKGGAIEIGRAGLVYAFTRLGVTKVLSFAEVHNVRSRAVMARLGFTCQREIRYQDAPCALYGLIDFTRLDPACFTTLILAVRKNRRGGCAWQSGPIWSDSSGSSTGWSGTIRTKSASASCSVPTRTPRAGRRSW